MVTKEMLKSVIKDLKLHRKHEVVLVDRGAMVYHSIFKTTDILTFIVPRKADIIEIALENNTNKDVIDEKLTISFDYNGTRIIFIHGEIDMDSYCEWSSTLGIYVYQERKLYKELIDDKEKLLLVNILSSTISNIENKRF